MDIKIGQTFKAINESKVIVVEHVSINKQLDGSIDGYVNFHYTDKIGVVREAQVDLEDFISRFEPAE
jgi:hypothetical protein